MRSARYQPGRFWFACGVALATWVLVWIGGLVTSHGAGMAVPDWPTTYGYNMFFFPVSLWTGGVFYEHTHRLVASAVGLLTIILAVWLWLTEDRRWVRHLGIAAVVLVIVQGVLGGLRVTEMMDELGIVHATLAQVFLVLLSAVAFFTSATWHRLQEQRPAVARLAVLRWVYAGTTALILLQLILGAAMRHQHAGLAVPDFPLAYGKLWPELSPEAVAAYNQARSELVAQNPITARHVVLHITHRMVAVLIVVAVVLATRMAFKWVPRHSRLRSGSLAWLGLISAQFLLGAATVWTNKSADLATLHVAVGALSLVTGALLWLFAGQCRSLPAPTTSTSRAAEPCGRQYQLPA